MDSGAFIFILVFIGIVWWAFSARNAQRFEDNAPAQKGDPQ